MPTALITGASSGIGLEIASLAAQDKHDLVLVARQRERLETVGRGLAEEYGVRVSVLAKDLSDPSAPAEIARDLGDRAIASSRSRLRATKTRSCRSRARRVASSSPMPLDAPVTRAVPREG